MSKEDFISVINGLDIKTIEGFYLKITNSDDVRGQIEQGLDCIDLEERVNEMKEHINYIIGITDDERVLAECNLILKEIGEED